ncbi:MAG: T9SS type A sorting domain-containing protein [bacterium]
MKNLSTGIISTVILIVLVVSVGHIQAQTPIVTATVIDSNAHNGIYRGGQHQLFYEPVTGNMVAAWYRYFSGDPDPRRITAAVSTDGGATWNVFTSINAGVGGSQNARYPTVYGTPQTPIVGYANRDPLGANQDSQPVVATDLGGWGVGAWDNVIVDNTGSPDTVLYARYVSVAVAPDNPMLWGLGGYHSAAPGGGLYYYSSTDGGQTWSSPVVVASEVEADSNKANYVADVSSTGLGIGLGINGEVFGLGAAQYRDPDNDLWRPITVLSTDGGQTFSPPTPIPGTENLSFGNGPADRVVSLVADLAGNWHVFGFAQDSTEAPLSNTSLRKCYDFRFDGTNWSTSIIATPKLIDNGIIVSAEPNDDRAPMNDAAIGPDGTLYYAYTDVVDTTGSSGDPSLYEYNLFVTFSEDNGTNWSNPVAVVEDWDGDNPNGMARFASDKLHICFSQNLEGVPADQDHPLFYMGVPTQMIKDLAVGVSDNLESRVPEGFSLHQNFPNPFNPTTTIRFDLQQNSKISLFVYNLRGEKVATLLKDEFMTAGQKEFVWETVNFASGTYFYTLSTENGFRITKKMVLLK